MIVQEVIRRKRDGAELSVDELEFFVRGLTRNSITEGQAAAFAMAVFFRGMGRAECAAFTRAMTRSGKVLDWSLDGPVLDKHSTGGVGDNISLILAPAVAACGGYVPMISGRGLGHTGGTLDKLESIPGYDATPGDQRFAEVVTSVGCAIIGQTSELAPADRRLYGIRDVTATVESIPLITASILSKKLAAGLQGLVMDVKCGSGAFMASLNEARALATSLADVATAAGLPTVSLITDMNEPLATAAGNAVEVLHAIDHLTGARRDPRVHEVVVALGAEMLMLGKLADDVDAARRMIGRVLDNGAAAERFGRMIAALGGPHDLVESPRRHLAETPVRMAIPAPRQGYVRSIDTRGIGLAVVVLGGGRTRAQDPVDPAVGFSGLAPLGAEVGSQRPLGIVHARYDSDAAMAIQLVARAYDIADDAAPGAPPVMERLAG